MGNMRNWTTLKKSRTEEELNEFCKRLALKYANSEHGYARSYFSEKYQITNSCYYKALEYAVVKNLVDDVTFAKMMNKSVANQNGHYKGAGKTSLSKYNRLYNERCKYIAYSLPEDKVRDIASDFTEKDGDKYIFSKYDLANCYEIAVRTEEFILLRAIVDNIIDDKMFTLIEKRSKSYAKADKKEMVEKFFEGLHKKREDNLKKAKKKASKKKK